MISFSLLSYSYCVTVLALVYCAANVQKKCIKSIKIILLLAMDVRYLSCSTTHFMGFFLHADNFDIYDSEVNYSLRQETISTYYTHRTIYGSISTYYLLQ